MPNSHKVRKGETLTVIAKEHGHRGWETIWQSPGNKALAAKRGKPENIQPGDVLDIPPNDKQQRELQQKLAAINSCKAGNLKLRKALENETDRITRQLKVHDDLIKISVKATQEIVNELQGNLRSIKNWATGLDAAKDLILLTRALVKLSSLARQSGKTSGEALKKINEEAMKEVKELARDPIENASIKALATLKERTGDALGYIGVVADSWEKMTSPSFWANVYVLKFQEGQSLSKAMTADVGDDIEVRIKDVLAEGDRQIKKLKDRQAVLKVQLADTERMIKECDGRIKASSAETAKLL